MIQGLGSVCSEQGVELSVVEDFEFDDQFSDFVEGEYLEGLVSVVFVQEVVGLVLCQSLVAENAPLEFLQVDDGADGLD